MIKENDYVTIEDAIRMCLDKGAPGQQQELSKLFREQEHLLESKYFLYKMVIKHLIIGGSMDSMRSLSHPH